MLESLAGSGRRVVVARMPFARGRALGESFLAELRAQAPALGIEVVDYSGLVSPERFVTRSHLDSGGHRLLARRLIHDLSPPGP
jgi:hypothetical protein